MSFILRPYGKRELYNELVNRGYSMSYGYFRDQLTTALEYQGDQLKDLKRRKTLSAFEVQRYIQECGLPRALNEM